MDSEVLARVAGSEWRDGSVKGVCMLRDDMRDGSGGVEKEGVVTGAAVVASDME